MASEENAEVAAILTDGLDALALRVAATWNLWHSVTGDVLAGNLLALALALRDEQMAEATDRQRLRFIVGMISAAAGQACEVASLFRCDKAIYEARRNADEIGRVVRRAAAASVKGGGG